MQLSPAQNAAVQRVGQDVCVVAGPGSGKTRVLVERYSWLVRQGIAPRRILAITFTEKAANEIKRRLVASFQDDDMLRQQIERAPVSTVHGFCSRLLREHALMAGLDPEFTMLDKRTSESERLSALLRVLNGLARDEQERYRALLDGWDGHKRWDDLLSTHSALRASGADLLGSLPEAKENSREAIQNLLFVVDDILSTSRPRTPKQSDKLDQLRAWRQSAASLTEQRIDEKHFGLLAQCPIDRRGFKNDDAYYIYGERIKEELLPAVRQHLLTSWYAKERETLGDVLRRLHANYQEAKRSLGALDFNDLEQYAVELLESQPQVRAAVQDSYEAVLMDELQDTNPLQWRLMSLLRRPARFFGVGDINQAIYGFRHADPSVFSHYQDEVQQSGALDELRDNYRSRDAILSAVQEIVGEEDGIQKHVLRPKRSFNEKATPCLEVIRAVGGNTDEAALREARWVARRIRELHGTLPVHAHEGGLRPTEFRDMAVLVRAGTSLAVFETAFQEYGIPFVMPRGRGFFEEQSVSDMLNWLRVLADSQDELAMLGVLRSPLVGVRDETLLALHRPGSFAEGLTQLESLSPDELPDEERERLLRFRTQLQEMRAFREDISPERLLARVMDDGGYEEGLSARERANIDKLLAMVRNCYSRHVCLRDALRELEEWREDGDEPNAPAVESSDAVQVMTMHASKGLEFPVVFAVALHHGKPNQFPSLSASTRHGLGAAWRVPGQDHAEPDCAHGLHKDSARCRESGEASRLLYVAMTRAEEHLLLCYAATDRASRSSWTGRIEACLSMEKVEPCEQAREVELADTLLRARVLCVAHDPLPWEAGLSEGGPEPAADNEPMLLPRQQQTPDLHDHSASVTAVTQYSRCPRQYYLEQYLGWPAIQTGPSALAFPPSDDPSFLEDVQDETHRRQLYGAELGETVHKMLANRLPDTVSPEAAQLASCFRNSEWHTRMRQARRREHEFDVVFALEDVVLRAQIDLWFEEPDGGLVLIDYKTDRIDPDREQDRVEPYALQIQLYALALKQLLGRTPTQAILHFLRPNRALPVSLEPDDLQFACKLVRDFRDAQAFQDFPMRPSLLCHACGFAHVACHPPEMVQVRGAGMA